MIVRDACSVPHFGLGSSCSREHSILPSQISEISQQYLRVYSVQGMAILVARGWFKLKDITTARRLPIAARACHHLAYGHNLSCDLPCPLAGSNAVTCPSQGVLSSLRACTAFTGHGTDTKVLNCCGFDDALGCFIWGTWCET